MLPIRGVPMLRVWITVCAALVAALPAAAAPEELLPRPAKLEPNIRFWTRIYTEIDRLGGLIHDSRHLDVVYEVLRLPEGLSSRTRERRIEAAKRRIKTTLRKLAGGKRSGLSDEEAHILSRWPAGVSNQTLREASSRLRFQLGQADKFRAGLVRSGAWRSYIEQVLRENDVPVELVALPHVESSYNLRAYSRVGAAGMWQFTRSTGRRYLRVDHVIDERMDPFAASVAAARLLHDNYTRLQAWPLAITAYNHGTAGMSRAVRKLGTRDMGIISERYQARTFGFASRNFYAEFLAALDVDSHAQEYFGPLQADLPQPYVSFRLDHFSPAKSLERALRIDREVLREYNPSLRPAVWNGAKYVPKDFVLRIPADETSRPVQVALAEIPAGERFAKQHRDRYYKVRRGDALSRIASRYRVKQSELVALNNLRSRHRIRVGQVLILPDNARGGTAPTTVARVEPPADGIYRVRRGDTLTRIATRFGVSQSELITLNSLRNRNRLAVGQQLRLPTIAASAPPSAPGGTEAKAPAAQPPGRVDTSRVASSTPPAAPTTTQTTSSTPMPPVGSSRISDPSDYAVAADRRITVQADETLGHYAEWLEVSAGRLRRLNGMRVGSPVVLGRKVRLDLSRVSPETFEQRRLAYHQTIQEEYFDSFTVTGTDSYTLRRGDTLWYLAERQFRVPVWLLRQYNPDVDFARLPAGARLVVPRVEPRRG